MSQPRNQIRARRVRALAITAAAMVALAALSLLSDASHPATDDRAGARVLPDFADMSTAATGIRVTLADETYTLSRGSDGWTLSGAGGFPVRADRLAALADGLEALTWAEPRTRDPGKFDHIGLGDPREGGTGALVEILGAEGQVAAALITGRKDGAIYARRPGESLAYRVDGDLPPLFSSEGWLDLAILDISADAISAVRLTDPSGASAFLQRSVGSGDRAFRPGPPFETWRVADRAAASATALALSRFQPIGVKPASALSTRPVARHVTLTYDGLEVEAHAYREADGFFITVRAVEAGEGASRGETINERASGWAFRLTELDWREFTPPVSRIMRPAPPEPAVGAVQPT